MSEIFYDSIGDFRELFMNCDSLKLQKNLRGDFLGFFLDLSSKIRRNEI